MLLATSSKSSESFKAEAECVCYESWIHRHASKKHIFAVYLRKRSGNNKKKVRNIVVKIFAFDGSAHRQSWLWLVRNQISIWLLFNRTAHIRLRAFLNRQILLQVIASRSGQLVDSNINCWMLVAEENGWKSLIYENKVLFEIDNLYDFRIRN